MNKTLWPILLTLILSACGTTSGTPASVEDRTNDPSKTASAGQGKDGKGADSKGVETTGIDGKAVSGSAVDGKALDGSKGNFSGDPRRDPASPISKRSIFFDYDSFTVKDEYRPALEANAAYLQAKRDAKIIIQGNTDDRGSREYNLALGQKRAEAVRKALAVLGVGEPQLEAVSFGEEKPRTEGETEAAYADNRRADIVYSDE
ncbi:MAG: peptidoglycan-associated lipoprotein Pal [Thiobacillaceae bacterium]